jgi:hypothetical protein
MSAAHVLQMKQAYATRALCFEFKTELDTGSSKLKENFANHDDEKRSVQSGRTIFVQRAPLPTDYFQSFLPPLNQRVAGSSPAVP